MKGWQAIALLCVVSTVRSQEVELPTPNDLPASELAHSWLQQDATVREAAADLEAARHTARMISASPNEWTARYSRHRRTYRPDDTRTNEWTAQLERTVRIPGKGRLDHQIGGLTVDIAQAELGEAVHEAARSLVELWMDWLAAVHGKQLLSEQLAFAQSNLHAVEVRARAGDAAKFEVNVAASDVAELQRRLAEASGAVIKARARLQLRFPDAPPMPPQLGTPEKITLSESAWRERILATADPLIMAELELQKAQRSAVRARADRVPDPTIGAYTGLEAFSSERIVGLTVSIPLPGRYRSQLAARGGAHVTSATAARDRQLQIIEAEVAAVYADAISSFEAWRLAEEGAARTRENGELTQRAYTLGETDLQTLLLARQQSLSAAQAALATRVAALRAHHLLLVDAHRIWGLDHEQ
jgi:outer membrane protein TolC